ncbi:MAG: tetratricopeptide repeat protein, partial [Flavobacteriia bacterium]
DLLALSNLALNLLFIGEYEEALKKYSEVNEINPKYLKADDYQNIGLAHYKLGKLDDALLNCNKSIRLKSNEQSVYNTRGLIYVAQNKMEEALADFTSAIELEPEFQMAILNRAILFHLLGDETKSYADFMTAKEQGCNCYGVAFGEGIYFLKEKKYEDARKSFVKAIEIYEEQDLLTKAEICYYLAIAHMELKNQNEACEYFSLAKSLNFTKENKKLQKFCAKN